MSQITDRIKPAPRDDEDDPKRGPCYGKHRWHYAGHHHYILKCVRCGRVKLADRP